MKVKINLKKILILLIILLIIIIVIFLSVKIYQYMKPVKTIFYHGHAFSFRDDVREALEIEVFPHEKLIYDLFWEDYKIKNVTILFKPADSKTNGLYQLEAVELTMKLSILDNMMFKLFRPKKTFNAVPIDDYKNITRENEVLKIILVPPAFSNETRVVAGGNRIFIYGKNNRDFDLATIKVILSVMNVTDVSQVT